MTETECKQTVSSMYTYLDSLERPSLLLEDVVLAMETELNNLYKKGQEEEWSEITLSNLLEAASIASSLAWSIENDGEKRSPEFFRNFHALRTTLSLLI